MEIKIMMSQSLIARTLYRVVFNKDRISRITERFSISIISRTFFVLFVKLWTLMWSQANINLTLTRSIDFHKVGKKFSRLVLHVIMTIFDFAARTGEIETTTSVGYLCSKSVVFVKNRVLGDLPATGVNNSVFLRYSNELLFFLKVFNERPIG